MRTDEGCGFWIFNYFYRFAGRRADVDDFELSLSGRRDDFKNLTFASRLVVGKETVKFIKNK